MINERDKQKEIDFKWTSVRNRTDNDEFLHFHSRKIELKFPFRLDNKCSMDQTKIRQEMIIIIIKTYKQEQFDMHFSSEVFTFKFDS